MSEIPQLQHDDRPGNGPRGRGGGKPNGPRSAVPREVQLSKKLSWLLRHGATAENLALDSSGYANLADVLANRKVRGLQATVPEVRRLVQENDKRRFALRRREGADGAEDDAPAGDWMIRANQGHSVKGLESEGLLRPLVAGGDEEDAAALPETVVHGTTHAAWPRIVASGGLKPMGRNHVHFASGLPATFAPLEDPEGEAKVAAPVISGMRASSTVLVYLDLGKAMAAGLRFWRSENGVILTEGGEEGLVGLQFFRRVEDRTGEGVLVEDGEVVKDAPASWGSHGKGRR